MCMARSPNALFSSCSARATRNIRSSYLSSSAVVPLPMCCGFAHCRPFSRLLRSDTQRTQFHVVSALVSFLYSDAVEGRHVRYVFTPEKSRLYLRRNALSFHRGTEQR